MRLTGVTRGTPRRANRSAAPRRRSASGQRRRLLRLALAFLLAVSAGFGATWAIRAGLPAMAGQAVRDGALALTARAGLTVQDVLVVGRSRAERDDLLAALQIRRGDPILGFSPEAARVVVEALPWVLSARVERRLPDTLMLYIVEREPMALWQHDGGFVVVDRHGAVTQRRDVGTFGHLPVIVGEDAPRHAAHLLATLAAEPGLYGEVRAAVRVSGRRWNVRLANGVEIRLPETGIGEAWGRLAQMERTHGLLARDVSAVDLRLPDRLVVRGGPDAPVRAGGPEKAT